MELFSKIDLSAALKAQTAKLQEETAALEPEYAVQVEEDKYAAYLVDKFIVNAPSLRRDHVSVLRPKETFLLVQDYGHEVRVPALSITACIPFDGDRELFSFRPSKFSFSGTPSAEVRDGEIRVTVQGRGLDGETAKKQINGTLDQIEQWLRWIRSDVDAFNQRLEGVARKALSDRRARAQEADALATSVGFPIRQRENAPNTYSVPLKPKSAAPAFPEATVWDPAEPTLPAKQYEAILSILRNMVHVMERSPGTFANLSEEAIRTHFLVQLNGQFDGDATAEAFNYKGKSDIRLPYQDGFLFIAECKFWTGPKAAGKTIDQLLGYLTWRDTKAAILFFNRNKDFTAVVEQFPDVLKSHSHFTKFEKQVGETEFRYGGLVATEHFPAV